MAARPAWSGSGTTTCRMWARVSMLFQPAPAFKKPLQNDGQVALHALAVALPPTSTSDAQRIRGAANPVIRSDARTE